MKLTSMFSYIFQFDCCGAILYTDWFTETHTQHIIHTCCPERECTIFTLPSRGCGNDLLSYASSSKYIQIMPYLTCITGIVQVSKQFLIYIYRSIAFIIIMHCFVDVVRHCIVCLVRNSGLSF